MTFTRTVNLPPVVRSPSCLTGMRRTVTCCGSLSSRKNGCARISITSFLRRTLRPPFSVWCSRTSARRLYVLTRCRPFLASGGYGCLWPTCDLHSVGRRSRARHPICGSEMGDLPLSGERGWQLARQRKTPRDCGVRCSRCSSARVRQSRWRFRANRGGN